MSYRISEDAQAVGETTAAFFRDPLEGHIRCSHVSLTRCRRFKTKSEILAVKLGHTAGETGECPLVRAQLTYVQAAIETDTKNAAKSAISTWLSPSVLHLDFPGVSRPPVGSSCRKPSLR
ncbi:MAG: hypothetical protein AAF732_12120 [Pseudomonadota bacterium]